DYYCGSWDNSGAHVLF
nr:immunoglobulin light chain junction region [Macaca mulatta]MOW38669.1 immunoglobulin light chain junction region [Macaca mulatta]MOW38798.1 immunoglobulin light chain junction region [Macaca mulatta]